ncbi:sugar phosphate isomerase/epimerase family protein [Kibdelosporangium lantanae]|uniref:Sugar phosphate isomerase/epimerase family protein n=1 Tax=Kibdelosporangium lantanae TaxID=1497396 RepID=A0ABW3MMU5_9PSEU
MSLVRGLLGPLEPLRVTQADTPGTLSKLADIGFRRVELAGLYGRSATEFKSLLDRNHMKATSSHVGVDGVDVNKVIEDAKILGNEKIVHPYSNFGTIAEWKSFAGRLETAGVAIRKAGLHLGYHNHDQEFHSLQGQRPYDALTTGTTALNVHLEDDLFWVVNGGADPVQARTASSTAPWSTPARATSTSRTSSAVPGTKVCRSTSSSTTSPPTPWSSRGSATTSSTTSGSEPTYQPRPRSLRRDRGRGL